MKLNCKTRWLLAYFVGQGKGLEIPVDYYQTRERRVSSDIQTLRSRLKKRGAAKFF